MPGKHGSGLSQADFKRRQLAAAERLCRVFDAGADVPEPYATSRDALLMEYVCTDAGGAPQLRHVELSRAETEEAFARILANVEIFLACDRVHADLSAYNVLYAEGGVRVIDFPQAVDARTSPSAFELLRRDLANVCRHFACLGLRSDPDGLARDLWDRYRRGRL